MRSRFLHLIKSGGFALTEGAIIERLRRLDASMLDQNLLSALLICSNVGKVILEGLHRQYIEIGRCYNLALLTFLDTWRTGSVRVQKAGMSGRDINGDCVGFLWSILHCYGDYADKVYLGGLIGCKGDPYRPEEELSEREASSYHSFQVDALAEAGVDFLFAAKILSLSEAADIVSAMARTGVPYAINFVLYRRGLLVRRGISAACKEAPLPTTKDNGRHHFEQGL